MSKARGLADLGNAYSDGALSNRNLIINGDFQVSQRGDYTSAFAPTNNAYYLDRWINSLNVVTGTLQDIGRKVKLVATSTGSGTFRILQKIELQTMNKFNNQTVTLSAKVKSNSAQARMGFYADGYLVPTGNATHTGDGTEQTLTAQITVPASTLTIEFDVFIGLQGASAGDNVSITSGDYVEITEVQLELGDTATPSPFEHRSYGDELQRCQRYFEKNFNQADAPSAGLNIPDRTIGVAFGPVNHGFQVNFAVTKRTAPTMVYYRGNNAGSANSGTVNRYNGSAWLEESISGGGRQTETYAGQDVSSSGLSVGSAYILQLGFTADAEL